MKFEALEKTALRKKDLQMKDFVGYGRGYLSRVISEGRTEKYTEFIVEGSWYIH